MHYANEAIQKICYGILGRLVGLLGASWGVLRRSWGLLRAFWEVLGVVLGGLGALLGRSWGGLGRSCGDLKATLRAIKLPIAFFIDLGRPKGAQREAFWELKWHQNRSQIEVEI